MTRGFSSIEIFFCSIGLFHGSCFGLADYALAELNKELVVVGILFHIQRALFIISLVDS